MIVKKLKLWQLHFQKKSKRKAWEWQSSGSYKFFTSSQVQKKYVNEYDFSGPALVFGTGWSASIHYCDEQFSTSTDCFILKTEDDQVYLKYVSYFLKWNISLLENGFKWAWLEHISKEYLSEIEIPLPSLKVQKSIVAKLDKLTELIDLKKEAIEKTEELTSSVFLEMFGDPTENNKKWETRPLRKIARIISWWTPSKECDSFWIGTYPWVSPKDMKTDRIFDSQDHISEKVFSETNLKPIPKNSILIVIRWMILAHTFPVAVSMKNIAINQDMKAVVALEWINYIFLFQEFKEFSQRILKSVSNAGHWTKRLEMNILLNLEFPIPPSPLQNHFSEIVQKNQSVIEDQKHSLQKIQELYDTTVQEVFSF